MKINITYDLPDDKAEYTFAKKGEDFYDALYEIYQKTREVMKHHENPSEELYNFAEQLNQIATESGIWEIE